MEQATALIGRSVQLPTKAERNAQLQLGHVDNDGKCDVAIKSSPVTPPRWYAKAGAGPWLPVQVLDPIASTGKQ